MSKVVFYCDDCNAHIPYNDSFYVVECPFCGRLTKDRRSTVELKPGQRAEDVYVLTERERDTILAALRLWQEINNPSSRRFYALNFKWRVLDDIATNGGNHDAPLDENEIDILIEDKINK